MYMKRILLAVVFFCCFLACSKEESNRLDGTSWVSSDDPTETVSFSNREVFFYYKNQLRYSANYTLEGDCFSLNDGNGLVIPVSDNDGTVLVITQGVLNEEAYELSFSCEERKDGVAINTFSFIYTRAVYTAEGMK